MIALINNLQLFIRSLLFYFFYGVMTIIVSSTAFITKPFLPFEKRYQVIAFWSRFSVYAARLFCGVRFQITGLEHLPKDQPYVVLSKHQSQWETYFLMYLLCPVSIICKKELLKIPIFGYCLALLKPIAIDRSNPKQALKDIQTKGLQRLLEEKIPVLIFPEGTRTAIGTQGKYARGGAALALKADVPVIFISHNSGYCWPSKKFIKHPGLIDIHISQPISPQGSTALELTKQAEQWIESRVSYRIESDKPLMVAKET